MAAAGSAIRIATIARGGMPADQRLTATTPTAEVSGQRSRIAAAPATRGPPSARRSSEKITATPAKPRRTPAAVAARKRSAGSAKWAASATQSGEVANSTAARPAGTHCSAQHSTPYGMKNVSRPLTSHTRQGEARGATAADALDRAAAAGSAAAGGTAGRTGKGGAAGQARGTGARE